MFRTDTGLRRRRRNDAADPAQDISFVVVVSMIGGALHARMTRIFARLELSHARMSRAHARMANLYARISPPYAPLKRAYARVLRGNARTDCSYARMEREKARITRGKARIAGENARVTPPNRPIRPSVTPFPAGFICPGKSGKTVSILLSLAGPVVSNGVKLAIAFTWIHAWTKILRSTLPGFTTIAFATC